MNRTQIEKMLEKYKAPFYIRKYPKVIDKFEDEPSYLVCSDEGLDICECDIKEEAELICMALNVFQSAATYALGSKKS